MPFISIGVFMLDEQAEQIAEQWLTHAAESAGRKDLKAHMGMISKRVSLQGVPGFDDIDYLQNIKEEII